MQIIPELRGAIPGLIFLGLFPLGLQRTFTEVGIKREDYAMMAKKACRYGDIKGFKTLTPTDVERIFEMCE